MSENVLDRNTFFVREHVGMFKAANNFDIFDPDTGEEIIHCREERLGTFTKMLPARRAATSAASTCQTPTLGVPAGSECTTPPFWPSGAVAARNKGQFPQG